MAGGEGQGSRRVLTVSCVLRSGGDYDVRYVEKLRRAVAKHLPRPYRLVCLSDVDVPCERIPLMHKWPGWWSKIELFRIPGPMLYFDLDTIITGDLSDIADVCAKDQLTLIRPFYRERGFASGMMGWNRPMTYFYDRFRERPHEWMQEVGNRGDQGFMEEVADRSKVKFWQVELPGQVYSYKVDMRKIGANMPEGARVVFFHGHPRPHEAKDEWLKEHWV